MNRQLNRTIGTVLNINKVRPNYTRLLIQTKEGPVRFMAFDLEASCAANKKQGDMISIDWYKDGDKIKYNKVYSICNYNNVEKEERKNSMIISGTITSLNNVRGFSSKKPEEVAFTVKSGKGQKVNYCYAPCSVYNSRWFYKGGNVQMEVSSRGLVNDHRAYSVITLWEK